MNDSVRRGFFSRLNITFVKNWKLIGAVGFTAWVLIKYPLVKAATIKSIKATAFVVIGSIELAAEQLGLL